MSARSQDESDFRVRCTSVSQMHFMRDIRFDFVDKSNPATVYTLLTRARQRLRETLGGDACE